MLANCGTSGVTARVPSRATLTTTEIPEVPPRYRECAALANLPEPRGGWTRTAAIKALFNVRASEIKKHDCLLDLHDWASGTLNGIRGGDGR